MKIERIRVFGFEPALFAMRNPKNSWAKSDSSFYRDSFFVSDHRTEQLIVPEQPHIGPKDLELACDLIKRGSEQRKFLREIIIWMNITIPRYVWQELDTYKVATTRMSCSTMHKLGDRDLDQSDFELPVQELTLAHVNELGRLLREAKEEHQGVREARRQLKNDLPEGFLQMATYLLSYETALSAILQREFHRLSEWRLEDEGSITDTLIKLPYMEDFYQAATSKRRALKSAKEMLAALIENVPDGQVRAEDLRAVLSYLKEAT